MKIYEVVENFRSPANVEGQITYNTFKKGDRVKGPVAENTSELNAPPSIIANGKWAIPIKHLKEVGYVENGKDVITVVNAGPTLSKSELPPGIQKKIDKIVNQKISTDVFGIISTLIEKFKGGPVGLTTISTAVGEEAGTIEEVYEPFLIQEGYLVRTPRGREVTDLAYKHLGKIPPAQEGSLFDT